MFLFGSKSKLGVDIGTSSIKVVQVKNEDNGFALETYGLVNISIPSEAKEKFDAITETAKILKTLLQKANVTTKKVVASLPNNIVFVSVIDMPAMSEKELKSSIEFEARRYVPLPIEEVTLSWSILKEPTDGKKIKALLTAVPTTVINNYLKMFKLAGLQPEALEIEALALIRSLIGAKQDSYIIIDIGARITSVNLVDKGYLRISRNMSVGGEAFTSAIAKEMKIGFARAEQLKKDLPTDSPMPQSLYPVIETIKSEVVQLINFYEAKGGTISELILTGAGSQIPGLSRRFDDLNTKVSDGDPLRFIKYPSYLKSELQKVSGALPVAIGLAMRQ